MLRKCMKTKDRELWNAFKRLRNLVTAKMRDAKKAHLAAACDDIKNPKRAWSELKTLLGKQHREPVQAIMTEDGEVTDDQLIALSIHQVLHKVDHQ